ncbi:hypothetical protein [Micromonospora sp. GCM10011541]|uniref:hypothetical protein n=1 Tax=Micromonospora sp. GCM10011541 TaxID=3317336 RepID=UPI003620D136
MIDTAHPEDILVVGWLKQAEQYPQFRGRQVVSTNSTQILHGRRIRRAYLAPGCGNTPHGEEFFAVLRAHVHTRGTSMRSARDFEADYLEDELAELFAAEESVNL